LRVSKGLFRKSANADSQNRVEKENHASKKGIEFGLEEEKNARMPVPKMVKNGHKSPFAIWRQFWAPLLALAFSQRPRFSN
jgi:hypothetical protein